MKPNKLGAWAFVDALGTSATARFAQDLEGWGYSALWTGEARGRDILVHSSWLLANTQKLIIASGIANIYARDAMAMAAARAQLSEQSSGRFLCGIGVSHAPLVAGLRGHHYGKPVATMREYLALMANAKYDAPAPANNAPIVLAALGPQMLALARDAADGAHPYNVTVDQTHQARQILGPNKLLCVEQKLLLERDPAKARAIARANLRAYLGLANYVNSWRRAGFSDSDFAGGMSDRLIDALVAWGDEEALIKRIEAHWAAGADHVCIQALPADVNKSVLNGPDQNLLQRLSSYAKSVNVR